MTDSPEAGWYASPDRPGFMQWWDGMGWTEHVQPIPPAAPSSVAITAPAPAETQPEQPPSKASVAIQATAAAGLSAVGAALAADGAIGLGSERKGLHGIAKYFIWAAVLFIVGLVGMLGGIFNSGSAIEGSPILGSVLIGLVAVLLFAIGSVKLLVRAGSIAGGALLIREGFRRGRNLTQTKSPPQ